MPPEALEPGRYFFIPSSPRDGDGNVFVVDEHAERLWLPRRHVAAVKACLEGIGGDDAADACRYLVTTKGRELRLRKLSGL